MAILDCDSIMFSLLQEAKLSQETLADQVVKTNEEKYKLMERLEAANKVKKGFIVYRLGG